MIRAVRFQLYKALKALALWVCPPDIARLIRAADDAQAEWYEREMG